MPETTGLQRALQADTVPPEKWSRMLLRTIIGIVFIALGTIGLFLKDWGQIPVIACVLVGATVWSTQVVVGALKALVNPVKAIKAAWKNGA